MNNKKLKIRKGDSVRVISGKDRGREGKVLTVHPKLGKVVVENVNIHTKFEKGKRAGQAGTKIQFPGPLPISKVQLIDSNSGSPTRIGYIKLENGSKQRIGKSSGKAV